MRPQDACVVRVVVIGILLPRASRRSRRGTRRSGRVGVTVIRVGASLSLGLSAQRRRGISRCGGGFACLFSIRLKVALA
jgi:hypothetical protein